MTDSHDPALELALLDMVKTELSLMHSFCQSGFPCDLSTTIAMRMSRSVVSAIIKLGMTTPERNLPLLTQLTTEAMTEACVQLEHLSQVYDSKLAELPNDHAARQCWDS